MKHKTTGGKLSLPRLLLMLTLVTLCSFLFAGAALANGTLDIIPDASNPDAGNSVKASHTYDYVFEADGITGVDTAAFYENAEDLFIKFPVVRTGDPADQFDLSPAVGRTVPVNVTVNGQVYYMQTVPTIRTDTDGRPMAVFDFQSANLAKTGWISKIEILGLRVKNTHVPNDSYKIEFTHYQPLLLTLYKSIRVVETVGEIVIDSPKTCVNIKAGSSFTVTGHVMKTCNVPWDYTSWPVKIEILDKKGRPAKMPVMDQCPITYTEDGQPIMAGNTPLEDMPPVCVSTTYNPATGTTTFTGTLRMPAYQYKYQGAWTNDYVIKVSTIEVKDAYSVPSDTQPVAESIEDKADTTLVGCPMLDTIQARQNYLNIRHLYCDFYCDDTRSKRAIALSAPETIHMIPAEPVKITWKTDLNEIKLNKPVEVTFCFLDKYCNPANILSGSQKVDLAAYYKGAIAGIFTDAAGNQTGHVYVPAGQSCATVMFVPIVPEGINGPPYKPDNWQITIEARAENVTSNPSPIIIAKDDATVVAEYDTNLELLAKVTDANGVAVAGWPVKASFFVNNLGATQNYKLHVEITDETGNSYVDINNNGMYDVGEEVACWGVDPGTIDFSYVYTDHNWYMGKEVGAPTVTNHVMGTLMGHNICQPWDTVTLPFSTSKQHIWIYPKVRIERCTKEGYVEPTIAYPKELRVKVVLEGPAGQEVMVAQNAIVNFADPVELMRSLDADSWQTLSTPKTLAGTGDLNFLIGQGSYDVAYKYVNGAWIQLTPGEMLQPLYCYYVKMRQPKHYGTEDQKGNGCYWNAAYIFDRADGPQGMIPPVRTLGIGWNSVGMAIQDTNVEDNNLWLQSDMLYRALGTICEGCKIVYNPGFPKVQNMREPLLDRTRLGNLADFQTVAVSNGTMGAWWDDPYADVYNGDNYWIYLTKAQDIASNVGLDVVDP